MIVLVDRTSASLQDRRMLRRSVVGALMALLLMVVVGSSACCTSNGGCCGSSGCDPAATTSPCCGWLNTASLLNPTVPAAPRGDTLRLPIATVPGAVAY
jgi:hypothetical protein